MARSTSPERAEWAFRTDPLHRDVYDELAAEHGLKRQIFLAMLGAAAAGLPRPSGTPAMQLDLAAIQKRGAEIYRELNPGKEVLAETA
ncbi:hypothetical protein [Saccharopolyspora griseoalba]|uniref:Uncharacterized protein n=1 Tax=Saccharopolyspora griseoalba TaxID=1431848 RepID=A0ABW2LQX6_9PSEU